MKSTVVRRLPCCFPRRRPHLPVTRPKRFGTYQVSGQVFNVGPEDAVQVSLVITLYDAAGRGVGVRRAEPEHNVIPPGGHTEFEIDLVPATGPVVTIEIIPQARRNSP